ncbi:hypothetical protein LY76DRAFT_586724 [Colletotrichum caudatum]|nr:hypothetical protein LY76DRAFT_586724 [Colletotrichum caudatum]
MSVLFAVLLAPPPSCFRSTDHHTRHGMRGRGNPIWGREKLACDPAPLCRYRDIQTSPHNHSRSDPYLPRISS